MPRIVTSITLATLSLAACNGADEPTLTPLTESQIESVRVVTPDQVDYQPLNPARGVASPQAGTLWGDIREDVPSGILLRFAEGFSSPPHIHNITYRAVVISGEVHNDDPDAANMWMGKGTFWTQPAGEVHITSARPGLGATAFLEILEGPYLVQPSDMAFDNGEQPLNLVNSNLVWMSADDLRWIKTGDVDGQGPEVALLWGDLDDGGLSASFVKLPAGHTSDLAVESDHLRAVIVDGALTHSVAGLETQSELGAGGFFESEAGVPHTLACHSDSDCLVYVRSTGTLSLQ